MENLMDTRVVAVVAGGGAVVAMEDIGKGDIVTGAVVMAVDRAAEDIDVVCGYVVSSATGSDAYILVRRKCL